LLDGTLGTKAFQVGANAGQTINVTMSQSLRSNAVGQIATATGTAVTGSAITADTTTIAIGTGSAVAINASVAGTATGQTADSAWSKAAAINGSGVAGLTATAANSSTGAFTTISATGTYSLTINDTAIYNNFDTVANGELTGGAVAAQINLYSTQTGVSATFSAGSLTLAAADGRNIVTTEAKGGNLTGGLAAGQANVTLGGTIALSASDNITFGGSGPQNADIGFASATIAKDANTISGINVQTADAANDAMKRIDSALSVISSTRATLGATLNRFSSTTSNLSNVLENITAAHSRIMDADFAAESANITKSQILQQAGISVLAQANTSTQSVLALLQKM